MKKFFLLIAIAAAMWQVCFAEDLPDTVWTKQGLPTVYDIKFLPDSKSMLVATMRGIFHIGIDGNIIDTIYFGTNDVRVLDIFPDGLKIVFYTTDGYGVVYDLIKKDTIKLFHEPIIDVAVAKDSKYLIFTTFDGDSRKGNLLIYEILNWKLIFSTSLDYLYDYITLSPNNDYFLMKTGTGILPKTYDYIEKWEIGTWKNWGTIYRSPKGYTIYDMDISPDGKYLAVGLDDSTAKIIDLNANKVIKEFNTIAYNGRIYNVLFSKDSKFLLVSYKPSLSGLGKGVKIWEIESGILIKSFDLVMANLDFSNDSKYLCGQGRYKEEYYSAMLIHLPKEMTSVYNIFQEENEITYPNPVTNKAQLKFFLINPSKVLIDLYDSNGIKLNTIFNNYIADGKHQFEIDMSIYPPGMYFCNIKAGSYFKTIKILKLR